jgi:broad specificity phosphatase PhoE
MPLQLLLVRHGETLWNQERRIQGLYADSPLSPLGQEQAQKTAEFLSLFPFDALYSSTLPRARETAEILAKAHPLKPKPILHAGLGEMHYGEWEGKTAEELQRPFPKTIHTPEEFQFTCPQGESYQQAFERFFQAIQDISQESFSHKKVVIVSHGMVILLFLSHLLGGYKNSKIFIHNCSIHRVDVMEPRTFKLITMNQIHHLDP